jgi:hypothetical protein
MDDLVVDSASAVSIQRLQLRTTVGKLAVVPLAPGPLARVPVILKKHMFVFWYNFSLNSLAVRAPHNS